MKEIYKKKIFSYNRPKTNVYVVVYGNESIIDDPLGRYQVEVHTRESIRVEEILYESLKRFCPEEDDIDAFLKDVLEEYGYKYVSFY